jgi:hypothetical protein
LSSASEGFSSLVLNGVCAVRQADEPGPVSPDAEGKTQPGGEQTTMYAERFFCTLAHDDANGGTLMALMR